MEQTKIQVTLKEKPYDFKNSFLKFSIFFWNSILVFRKEDLKSE